jgi:U3 small nucleolar RNA-associated protein 22
MFEDANINVPLGGLGKKMMKEGTYSFQPPVDVFCIGSHVLNTKLKTNQAVSIDLALEIDASFFSERDYLNYRYFLKRSIYISHVYLQLMGSKKYSKAKFEFLADYSSIHKPVLCVALKDEPFEINLHVVPSSAAFKLGRFNPTQSNVRRDFFTKFLNSYVSFEQNGKSWQNFYFLIILK